MADNSTIESIKAVGAIVTPLVLAWIAYKQVSLSKKQEQIHKDVNGKMAQLLDITGAKERAEGKLEGKEEQKAETKDGVVDVKIVDQEKVIKVGIEPTKDKT